MSRRTIDAERVTAWIELSGISSSEWLLATVTVKNPSHVDIKVEKLSISLPDFRLGDLSEVTVDDGAGNRVLPKDISVKSHYTAMSFDLAVGSGKTNKGQVLIYQPARSRKKFAKLNVMYWTMEPNKKWRILPIAVKTRPDF